MSDETVKMDAKTIILRWLSENYEPLSDYYGETFGEAGVKLGDTLEEARAKLLRSFEQTNNGFLISEELDETDNATDNDRLAKKALVDLTDGQLDEIMREFEIGRLKNGIWDDQIRFTIINKKNIRDLEIVYYKEEDDKD